jgi:aspartyl-tRNA(Asn)/glutamyl-tRNA(Gln) amidotransferase subunit C
MKISIEEMKRLQKLSALESSEQTLSALTEDFNEIANFVEQVRLAEVDEALQYETILQIDELRKDEVKESMPQQEVIKNAPEKNETSFVVPKVVD